MFAHNHCNNGTWFSASEAIYPAIESFWYNMYNCPKGSLQSLVVKLPNLKSLIIEPHCDAEDLESLKSLSKLSDLRIIEWHIEFQRLYRIIGNNIIRLALIVDTWSHDIGQSDLDLIFKYCPNLEYFEFESYLYEDVEELVVPPFLKLKDLRCRRNPSKDKSRILVEFSEMPELGKLVLWGFGTRFEDIEFMVFDNTRFPKLKKVATSNLKHWDDVHLLRRIAETRNSNIEFEGNEEDSIRTVRSL